MDPEVSSSSDESAIESLEGCMGDLIPIVSSLQNDIENVNSKILALSKSWYTNPAIPISPQFQELWVLYKIPEGGSVQTFLNIVFERARIVDLTTRAIYFSEEDSPLFGKESSSIFELLHQIIDSVDIAP